MATISRPCASCSKPDEDDFFGPEINALRLEACSIFSQKNTASHPNEHSAIGQAAIGYYGSPRRALSNLVANLPNHDVHSILAAYTSAMDAGVPDEVITNDHIIVHRDLCDYRRELDAPLGHAVTLRHEENAEFASILFYALNFIEDGHLIVSLYKGRGIHTYQGILDTLPAFRGSTQSALSEGTL